MKQSLFVIIALLVLDAASITHAQTEVEKLIAESNPAIQAQINATYRASQLPRVKPGNSEQAFRDVQVLKGLTDDKGELVKQLAIFAVTTTSEEDRHLFAAGAILHFLDLPPSIPIQVLAPYLDSQNQKLRFLANGWFAAHDNTDAARAGSSLLQPVNYYDYMKYVRSRLNRNEEIPAAFTEYIYQRYPGRALLVFAYANDEGVAVAQLRLIGEAVQARQQGRELTPDEIRQRHEERRQIEIRQRQAKKERSEILLAEHIVSNAIWLQENGFNDCFQKALPEAAAELAKLAKHNQWWARLYVAYVMRQHPELRQTDVLQQLSGDSNALVSKTAQSVKQ